MYVYINNILKFNFDCLSYFVVLNYYNLMYKISTGHLQQITDAVKCVLEGTYTSRKIILEVKTIKNER